jgi:RNA polymerase sigma-70 factor (ECF subfamily)
MRLAKLFASSILEWSVSQRMDEGNLTFALTASPAADVDQALPLAKEVEALFDHWRVPLLGYVVTLRLPIEEAEEVVQDVFLSLFKHLRVGKSRENLRGWIFRVGHNLALKRRHALSREVLQRVPDGFEDVRDLAPNPETAVAIKERQARLLAVVAALSEQDRCCLHLRAEGLRYREIAEVLGISLGSVAISLGRSLERLRNADEDQ